jgi:peptidoglycan/LPS O-acetylase OafA/YrhL
VIESLSPTLFAVAPAAVSLATAVVIMQGGPAWLTIQPIRYIGRISYGIYLYHWPLFVLGEEFKDSVHSPFHLYAAGLIALIVIAAALSYEFVEKPFLNLKTKFEGARSRRSPETVGILMSGSQ